ncbi:MAG TPA: redoxin family protein [Candidatus Nanoarchaeia archaeon]|nr:redoxin family protein [Candidatus Nanoarchaeia archaeon]
MKTKTIAFIVLLALVIAAIIYLQEPSKEVERVSPAVQKKNGIPAPELVGIAGYINADNITIKDLVGKKVILVDIWTYSCINCQRTLPYLTMWYDKYNDKGLEIIGVHSPEFEFEKKYDNVKRAVEKWNIKYPVVLDNDHATWNAFMNRYWPRKYLIDIDGYVVWDHIGEGGYDEAERKIQELLEERMVKFGMTDSIPLEISEIEAPEVEFYRINTPEIYLGYEFTRGNFGNKEGLPKDKEVKYSVPSAIAQNNVYLEGDWFVDKDHVRLVSETGKVVLKYDAKNVNIVASGPSELSVIVDDKQVQTLNVDADDLYSLIDADYGKHTLSFNVKGAGFKLYTFTFG